MRDEPMTVAPSGLIDAIDAVLETGAVVAGDVVVSLAGVDLIYVNLRALVASMETALDTALETAPDKSPDKDRSATTAGTT